MDSRIFLALGILLILQVGHAETATPASSSKTAQPKSEGREVVVEKPVAPGMPNDFNPQSQAAKILSVPLGKPKPKASAPPVTFSVKTPLFLDVRSAFEFETGHVKLSQPIRWRDFVVLSQDNAVQGLERDSANLARRLATSGVHPDRVTYVVGKDLEGNGEEGRVAWMLTYLGVKDVRLRKYADMPEKKVAGVKDNQVASPWQKPEVVADLKVSLEEAKEIFKSGSVRVQWIDVREKESFKAGHVQGAIFFDWKQLSPFEKNQYEKEFILKTARNQNVFVDANRLIVYSDDGVRAALVAFMFKKAGLNAAVLDSGFEVVQSALEITR